MHAKCNSNVSPQAPEVQNDPAIKRGRQNPSMSLHRPRPYGGIAAALLLACSLVGTPLARAETLPLSSRLIRLDGDAGAGMLVHSTAKQAYWPLSIHFVTQATQSYCGVATMVMVLNAMGVPAPTQPGMEPYRMYTQDNVLNAVTERILPQPVLAKQGMTLDQFGAIAETFGLKAEVHHAAKTTLERFRELATRHLAAADQHVVVNYLRREIDQERGGHISPLAAYDARSDRFLILDVARYKYPPVWVKAADLYAAMNTADADNGGQTRGFVLVSKR